MSIDERKVKWDSEVSIDESKIKWDEPKAIDESKIKWDEPKDQDFIQENLAGYGKAPEDLTTLEKILRGVSSANLRMQEAVNGANDWLGNGIKPTQEELNNQKWLRDTLESDKEKLSQANITPERKQAIEALKQQSANARGFGENAKAVISTLYDTATHPSEWTAQGVTEGIFSPENIASINPISKGATVGARLFSGAGNAALENVLFGTPIDIAQAKGQGKSDEEIKNTAIQSAVGNLLAGATIGGTTTGLKEGYSKLRSKPDTIEEDTQTPTNFDAQSYLDSTKASKASEELGLNEQEQQVAETISKDNNIPIEEAQKIVEEAKTKDVNWDDFKVDDTYADNSQVGERRTMEEIKAYIAENDKGGQAQADLFEQQMNLWAKAENLRRAEEGREPVTAEQMANDFILKYEDTNRVDTVMKTNDNELLAANGELFQGVKSKEQKEKRGIYNVQNNDKASTIIYKDADFADNVIKYERGFENPISNKGFGALHIDKHLDINNSGWVTRNELLNIGNAIRNTKPYEKDGKRIYEYYNNDGTRFRIIVGDAKNGERTISFYSNRKAGIGNDTLTYNYSSQAKDIVSQNTKELNKNIKGSYTIDQKLIQIFKDSDSSTINHELGHRFLYTLNARERAVAEQAFGVKDGNWKVENHEAFADAYARYIADGKVQSSGLKAIFEKFKEFTKKILSDLQANNGGKLPPMSKEVKEFFSAVLGYEKARSKLLENMDGKEAQTLKGANELFQTSKKRQDRLMEWHKDSAPETKNADGTPKVFYHGTGADFSEFKKTNILNGSAKGNGYYFTSNPKVASSYAKEGRLKGEVNKNDNIMPVYIYSKKPFLGFLSLSEKQKEVYLNTAKDRNEILKDMGFDAVIDGDTIVAFNPEQIKSIHNKGTFDENNPNILYQRTDLSVGDETLMESVQRKVQDKFLRVKKLIEAKANINAIADKLNPYLAEELYHGRVQNRLDQFQKDYVEPIIKKISSSKVTIDQVDEYLHARHAIERNRKMEELNGIKDGSGMSDAEAVRILARYANNTDMLDIAKMVYDMNKDRLKLIYKEGLESADFIKTIDGTYNNYVPLKRVMDSDGNYMSTGKGFDIKGKELKRAHGSNREVESPLLNSILAFNETIIRAEKNEVGKAMINFAEAYPDANLYEVNSLKHVPQYDSNGDVISMNPKYQLANNVLHVKIDGNVKEIVFKDPLLARAFKNLSSEQMDAVMRGAHKLIRYYASINTQYNPEFVISNFERDLQTAMINLPEEVKGSRAIILRDVFSAMNGIHKAIYERTPNEWSKLYAEMKAEGGTTGWIEQYNVPDMKKSTEILIKKYEGEVMPKEAFKAALEHIDNINTVIENASRLVVYKMAKESGLSNKRSASIAKNLTVNFNRKGEMGQALNLMYMFFNASIQGTTRTLQAIKHSKTVQGIVGGIIASSTALTLYNMSQNEEAYSLIPQYEKDTNLIFMNEDGTYKKVKVPYGYNVFKSLGDIMAEAYNGDLKPEKMPSRILGVAVNAFSPIGTAPTLGQMLTPTIARPAVDLAVNKNFAGNPIQPEKSGFGASSPDSYNYFNSVNPIAKSIAQEANKLTGGNMYKSGMADVSPETIEYLFETATGGVGKFFNRVYKTASGNAETNDIPFVRNFIGETTDKSKQSKVYDIYKRSGEEIINQKELDRFVKFGRDGVSNGSIEPDRFISMVTTIASNQAKLKWADRNNIQSKDDVLNSPSIMMDALQSGVPKSEILSIAKKKKKEDEALLKR